MTTEKRKTWVVRSWSGASNNLGTEAEHLEHVLNALADDGYKIHQLDTERRLVTAYSAIPPVGGLLEVLLGGKSSTVSLSGTPTRVAEAAPKVEEPEVEREPTCASDYLPKGQHTDMIVSRLADIMEANAAGDPHTKERVASLVKRTFNRVPREEVAVCLNDLKMYHKLHVAARIEKTGEQCSDSCATHIVLTVAEEELQKHLESNPLS